MSWDTTLEYYLGFGLASARPASGNPAPNAFEFYYAYDTPALYVWNSNTSAWDAAAGGGTGTVTSVGLTLPGIFSVSGSPVTSSGTLEATLETQSANLVWAGPASGSAVAPAFRGLVTADLPAGTTQTIASGTAALGTSAIASGGKASTVTVTAIGVASTDALIWGFNSDPTSTTGYAPSTSGMLTIIAYPSSGNVNFIVVNNTGASITPGAVTLNWRVVR